MPPAIRRLQLDLLVAFAASGAKVIAYALISTILFASGTHTADLAIFTLIRSTLGLVNYATLGLAPAYIRKMAAHTVAPGASPVSATQLYASAQYPALLVALVAMGLLTAYSLLFNHIHVVPEQLHTYAPISALLVGVAMLLRLISDIPGGYLQATHRITLDNLLLLSADLLWPLLTVALLYATSTRLLAASLAFAIAYALLCISRFAVAAMTGAPILAPSTSVHRDTAMHLLAFGVMLTLSQLSDFLYAPTDFLLINWYLTPRHLADYSIAVQLDAALLLVTAAIATVLYPRAAAALATGDTRLVRRYYVQGTLLTLVLLIVAGILLLLFAKPLLLLWLRTDSPGTRAILPLLLIHSILGGSSAAGRAILLAAGKARTFAAAAVAAGVLNVIVSYLLVRYTSLALTGVILGTIASVVLRCGIWIPWYTMRTIRQLHSAAASEDSPSDLSSPQPL